TELAKIYQHKGKYDEAEKILLEILSINSMNCYAMAELVHVYTKNQNPEKCFQVFDEFLKNCRLDKKRRREPQAMFHYIFKLCLQFRRHDKARQYFEKYSHFLDDRNKTLFHQFFG
ncbi:MAG: hypothetical protein H8D45_07250, partial [Bacteroidetes bacterium]|nr:hypothetical protein [Bacteroidota bacterium]